MVSVRGREFKRRWMFGILALVVTGCLLYARSGQCGDLKPQRQLSQDPSISTCSSDSLEHNGKLKRSNAVLAQQVRKLEAQLLDARATHKEQLSSESVGQPTTALKQPTTALKQPTIALKQPTIALKQPMTALKQPMTALKQPTTALKQPTTALKQPTTALKQPTTALKGDHTTSALPPIYNAINEETKESFENECRTFRVNVPPEKRLLGIAGLFNTGTNLMSKLLNLNCKFKGRSTNNEGGSRTPWGPVMYQVPSGKHNHPHWQGKYFPLKEMRERWTATGAKSLSYDHLITVVLIKDPLNWMSSMCRNRYVANGPWWRGPKCPMLLNRNAVIVKWDAGDGVITNDGRQTLGTTNFKTILDFWSEWHTEYFEVARPRFFMRYEDLLFDQEKALKATCTCAGGELGYPLVGVSRSAKAEAGMGGSSLGKALNMYSSPRERLKRYTDEDLQFIRNHPRANAIMQKLGYFIPEAQQASRERGEPEAIPYDEKDAHS